MKAGLLGAAVVLSLTACDPPFGVGLPTTKALEEGVAATLDTARSFEISGSYREDATRWSIDVQLARPDTQHMVVASGDQRLEAVVLGQDGYFRGRQILAERLGGDPVSRSLLTAVGDAWWKGSARNAPQLPHLTGGDAFRTTFLGSAATQRTDHVSLDGVDAVDLAGPRAEVFIAADPPYRPIRVHLRKGVSVDGLAEADLHYLNFDRDFGIKAPANVIDFSNLSSLPPLYTVLSVDTSRCASPCVVSALIKNLGAIQPAKAHSTITFVMTDNASRKQLGSCQVRVAPDVGYNVTTTVQCTIEGVPAAQAGAATVTATPDNPGRA